MGLSSARRSIINRLAFLFFLSVAPASRAGDPADDLAEKTVTVRTGVGYKDNVTLSHFNPQSSPLFRTGLDADWLHDFQDDSHLMVLVDGDDWIYWDRPSTGHEDLWTAAADYKKNSAGDFSFSTLAFYGFENQVLDLTTEENFGAAPAKVIGHTLALRPAGRWNFETNLWTQLRLDLTRQFFRPPADSYTRVGPELSIGGDYGNNRSEWSIGYEPSGQRYDHGRTTDSTGMIPSDTARIDFRQRLQMNDTHNWDKDGRLQSISQLFAEYNIDNGSGFFDYYRYGGALELDYDDDRHWELSARVDASRFQFFNQTASATNPDQWSVADVTVDLSARRRLTHWLKIFAEYEYERSFSNRPQEDYQANTVSGGLEWFF